MQKNARGKKTCIHGLLQHGLCLGQLQGRIHAKECRVVAADYACYMNGVTDLALTKLDVLDSFETIKVCTGYMIEGEYYSHLPDTLYQEKAKPIYEDFKGWLCDTSKCRTWEALPENARNYILEIEKRLNTHITYISVGPERDQLIVR